MPYYGIGSWKLPEFGITEKLGGKKKSVGQAYQKSLPQVSGTKAAAYVPKPIKSSQFQSTGTTKSSTLGASTYKPSPTSGGGGGSTYTPTVDKEKDSVDREADARKKAEEAESKRLRAQIDEEYSNIMGQISGEESRLGGIRTQYEQQLPLTEQQITQSYGEVTPEIERTQSQALADLSAQQTAAQRGFTGVAGTARQTYNELLSGANRLGGSAQQAYGELMGRGLAKTIGEARSELANTLTEIAGETQRVREFYGTKISDLAKKKNLAIEQARADFRTNIDQINQALVGVGQNKIAAQKWKSTQNLSALAQFQQRVSEITTAAETAKRALDQWAMETNATLQSARDNKVNEFKFSYLPEAGLGLRPEGFSTAMRVQAGELPASDLEGYLYNTKNAASEEDDLSKIIAEKYGITE